MDEQKLNLSKTNFLRVWCCARFFFVASSMFWKYLVNIIVETPKNGVDLGERSA